MTLKPLAIGIATAGTLSLASLALAQSDSTPNRTPPAAPTGASGTGAAPGAAGGAAARRGGDELDGGDRTFLENAAQGSHAEIEASKMAEKKASDPEVKAFAQKMMEDHSKANQELAALAKKKGYTPPEEPSLMQKAELKALSLTDDGFDAMYANRIGVAAHEATLDMFKEAAENAKDPEIKEFAASKVPVLEEHLKMARALDERLEAKKDREKESDRPQRDRPQRPAAPGSGTSGTSGGMGGTGGTAGTAGSGSSR
jgi:putative membrane protein